MPKENLYESVLEASEFLIKRGFGGAKLGVILGSGLGAFADTLENRLSVPYEKIPGFSAPHVEGHPGKLVFGTLPSGVPVLILQGRIHYYEGHPLWRVVFPVRVLARLGVETLIITNASGGVNPAYQPGDLVLISDHLNLMGDHPLIGPNDERLGKRFPDMTRAYPKELRDLARQVAEEQGLSLQEGVYAALSGPTYETPAEIRMLRTLGADMVGMSTVPEVICAVHMGVRVLGLSCVTNLAAGVSLAPIEHSHVEAVAAKARQKFTRLLENILTRLAAPADKEQP